MKQLTEICKSAILTKYSVFKPELNRLPNDLKEEIEKKGEFNSKYQVIGGKIYPRDQQQPVTLYDWATYR